MNSLMRNRGWPILFLSMILVLQWGCTSSEFRCRGELSGDRGEKKLLEETSKNDTIKTIAGEQYNFEAEGTDDTSGIVDTFAMEERVEPIDTTSMQVDEIDLDREGYTVGYRIQVFASKSLDKAKDVKKEVEKVANLPAYIEYEEGLYKVRLGDFIIRDEALKARDLLREHYKDCWVVQTTVKR